MPDGFTATDWSPDGKLDRLHQPHPATSATTPRTRAGSRRARSRRSSPGSTARAGSFDRPAARVRRQRRRHRHARNLTPGPHQHAASRGCPTPAPSSPAAPPRRLGPRPRCDLYVVPLDGEIRALTTRPATTPIRRCLRTARTVAFLGIDDAASIRRTPRRRHRHRRRRDPLDLRRARPQRGSPTVARQPVWTTTRRCSPRRGPRRDPPVRADRRRITAAEGPHQGAARGAGLRRRRRHGGDGPGDGRSAPPSWSRSTARSPR